MAEALRASGEKVVAYLLDHGEGSIEYSLDFTHHSWQTHFSDSWSQVLGANKIIDEKTFGQLEAAGRVTEYDKKTLKVLPPKMVRALSKKFPSISATKAVGDMLQFVPVDDSQAERKVQKALAILDACNYDYHPTAKMIFGVFNDGRRIAQVDLSSKEIRINVNVKEQSLFEVVTMIVEEHEHLKTRFNDETRSFQQHFINLYVNQLCERHEVEI